MRTAVTRRTGSGSITPTYDTKGNLTSAGTTTYGHSSENLLTSATGGITLAYDPAMRLYQLATASTTTRTAYDGFDRIAEYDGSNGLLRRYVHGPGDDEPIVWYEGTGTTNRRFLGSDDQGSIISLTDSSGALLSINRYDEYGIPQSTNLGAFGYTGQAWVAEIGESYYKSRIYEPELGRFLQTDPIGYADSPNLYNYVLGDPVNNADPLGLGCGVTYEPNRIVITKCINAPIEVSVPGGFRGNEPGHEPGHNHAPQQPTQQPTTRKTPKQCAWEAAKANALGIGLDLAGVGANLLLPEGSAAASISGATIGVIGIGAAAADQDVPAGVYAYTGHQAAVAEGTFKGVSSQLAHRIGIVALTASSLYDIGKTIEDYRKCMAEGSGK